MNIAKTTAEIKDITYSGQEATVSVYEWTFLDYTGDKGLVDTSGYGVNHEFKFNINNGDVKLISDTNSCSVISAFIFLPVSNQSYGMCLS